VGGLGVLGHVLMLGLVVVVGVAVAYGSVLVADRTLSDSVVGLVFGALLGFTVVVSWEQFSSAAANVAHEASTLSWSLQG